MKFPKDWWQNRKKDLSIAGMLGMMTVMLLAYNNCGLDMNQGKNVNSSGQSTLSKTGSGGNNSGTGGSGTGNSGNSGSGGNVPAPTPAPVAPAPTPEPVGDPTNAVVMADVEQGVKSFEEILHTMSVLTGVPVSANIQTVFNDLSTQMPSDNSLKSLLPAHQVAIVKLATEFCSAVVADTAKAALIWPNFNLGTAYVVASQAPFSTATKQALIDQTITRFMPLVADDAQMKAQVTTELMGLFTELLTGAAAGATTTRSMVTGLCITSLSSIQTIML